MSMVSFPGLGISVSVKEVAFRVFGWPIHWYGLIIATGFLLAVLYCNHRVKEFGIEEDDIIDLLIYAVPLCIIGARLYYIVFELSRFQKADGSLDFRQMLRIWDGGLAIYGGVLMAIVVALLFCKKRKISFWAIADVGSMGLLIGQLVGRWGNFVNVECYGGPTTLPWRMGIYDTVNGVYQYMEVHPTFLYESLWEGLGSKDFGPIVFTFFPPASGYHRSLRFSFSCWVRGCCFFSFAGPIVRKTCGSIRGKQIKQ